MSFQPPAVRPTFLVKSCARERVRSLPPNFDSTSTFPPLSLPSISTRYDGSFGVTRRRESPKSR